MMLRGPGLTALLGGPFALLLMGAANAADLRVLPAPPALSLGPSGYGEIFGGTIDSDFLSGNGTVWGGGAYVNMPLSPALNLEVEARGYAVHGKFDSTSSDIGAFAHLYWRDPARYALGAFAGYTRLTLYGSQHGDMFTGGAEAQGYFGPFTLYGQAAVFDSNRNDVGWLDFHGAFARATLRYFVTPNVRLQIDGQFTGFDGFDHFDVTTVIGTAEYRFDRLPFSAFAQVRWDSIKPDVNRPGDDTMVLFGIRGYFGNGTLIDNERHGAPLDVIPFPPTFALNLG